MALNKVKQGSNMYQFLNDNGGHGYTWNVIKGKCPHQCSYCYCKRWGKQPELHFDEKELKTNLGEGNFIFVGSSCDMWSNDIPKLWINKTLLHCYDYPNKYLFQTKNPAGFEGWLFPPNIILGITLESNRAYLNISQAPLPLARVIAFSELNYPKMVSIEPIMDFDIDLLVEEIKMIAPEFISIGADSQQYHLPEPSGYKIKTFIGELQGITTVKQKGNLRRLLNNP